MSDEQQQAMDALQFFADSVKTALLRQQTRIERLEDAFLKEHPFAVLPEIEYTDEEKRLLQKMEEL